MSGDPRGKQPISSTGGYVTVILFTRTPFYLKTSCHVTLQLRHLIVIFVCLLRLDGRCNGCLYCFSFPKLPLSRWNVSIGIDRDVESTLTFNFHNFHKVIVEIVEIEFRNIKASRIGVWHEEHQNHSKPINLYWSQSNDIGKKNSDGTIAWEIRLFVS